MGIGGVDDAELHIQLVEAGGPQGVVVLGVRDIRADFAIAQGKKKELCHASESIPLCLLRPHRVAYRLFYHVEHCLEPLNRFSGG